MKKTKNQTLWSVCFVNLFGVIACICEVKKKKSILKVDWKSLLSIVLGLLLLLLMSRCRLRLHICTGIDSSAFWLLHLDTCQQQWGVKAQNLNTCLRRLEN